MAKANLEQLPPDLFDRIDDSPDTKFYQEPRFVAHIDEKTIGALSAFYREILFNGADVLDLMSSWISHLPEAPELARVAGLGMNAAELAANPRLNDYVVHDLNNDPTLPYATSAFDFVFIAVSIQYLVRPINVFTEIARVLRPGGQVVVSTSHRCFPTKAIRAFREARPENRIQLITEYVRRTGGFKAVEFIDRSPSGADPLWLVRGTRKSIKLRTIGEQTTQ
jgi:SAM-dependent methyltransferase